MPKHLTRTVFIDGVPYGPTSEIPAAIATQITNPRVWVDVDAATPSGVVADTVPSAPPRSPEEPPALDWTVKELREYAKAHDVVLGAAKAKEEILRALGVDLDQSEDSSEDEATSEATDDATASDDEGDES